MVSSINNNYVQLLETYYFIYWPCCKAEKYDLDIQAFLVIAVIIHFKNYIWINGMEVPKVSWGVQYCIYCTKLQVSEVQLYQQLIGLKYARIYQLIF